LYHVVKEVNKQEKEREESERTIIIFNSLEPIVNDLFDVEYNKVYLKARNLKYL
jgi:hypothetical protein